MLAALLFAWAAIAADPDYQCHPGWKDGPNQVRGSEGQLLAIVTCKAGKRHGPYKGWYPDGTQRVDGNYENGLRHGNWTRWSKEGKIKDRGGWSRGEANGPWRFYQRDGSSEVRIFCGGEDCAQAGQKLTLLAFRAYGFYGTQPGLGYVYSGQFLWSPSYRLLPPLELSLQAGTTLYVSQTGGLAPTIDVQGVLALQPASWHLVPFGGAGYQIIPGYTQALMVTGGVDYRFRQKILGIFKGLTLAYSGIFADTTGGMIHTLKLGALIAL